MAAGVGLLPERFEGFREAFEQAVREQAGPEGLLLRLAIEAQASLGKIDMRFMEGVSRMEPFGAGNPRPVLMAAGVHLAGTPKLMGQSAKHLSFYVTDGGPGLRVVAFGMGDRYDEIRGWADGMDIAFSPTINEFQGSRNIELHLVDARAAGE
jgi:single-stranded-DNA-specific exonuclease